MITQQEINDNKHPEPKFNYKEPFRTKCGWPARFHEMMQRINPNYTLPTLSFFHGKDDL